MTIEFSYILWSFRSSTKCFRNETYLVIYLQAKSLNIPDQVLLATKKTYLIKSLRHKADLVKAVLELRHVPLEHGRAHEVGEEDGLQISHLVPVEHLEFIEVPEHHSLILDVTLTRASCC